MRIVTGLLVALLAFGLSSANAEDVVSAEADKAARDTLALFMKTDPSIEEFMKGAAGFAVFPKVGKAGFVIGGSHGKGVVYEGDMAVGAASITSGQIGLVAGVESFSELIVLQTPDVLERFKSGSFTWDAKAGATAAKSGAASNAQFADGVAVFVTNQGGLMGDISVGAQKFSFTPVPE